MNRRESLKTLTIGSLTAGTLIAGCEINKKGEEGDNAHGGHDHKPAEGDGQRPAYEKERDAGLLKEQFFNEHEMATITVLANLIIPADEHSGNAEEAGVPEFIEFMAKDHPSNQTPLRGGLRWMDIQTLNRFGKAFKDCSESQQKELLDEIAWPEAAKPEMQQGVVFFNRFRGLVATGFWTSQIGIRDLGYQGNVAHAWDGPPQEVLDELGVSYDPELLPKYINQEDRNKPMEF